MIVGFDFKRFSLVRPQSGQPRRIIAVLREPDRCDDIVVDSVTMKTNPRGGSRYASSTCFWLALLEGNFIELPQEMGKLVTSPGRSYACKSADRGDTGIGLGGRFRIGFVRAVSLSTGMKKKVDVAVEMPIPYYNT